MVYEKPKRENNVTKCRNVGYLQCKGCFKAGSWTEYEVLEDSTER